MTSPRPYVAAAAASVLAALYFVPSATASPSHPQAAPSSVTSQASTTTAQSGDLADTGAMNTKPYMIGGAVFLVAGAGLVLNAGRRSRQALEAESLDA
jgi:hypothetical protein